jgi:hypothetical protein
MKHDAKAIPAEAKKLSIVEAAVGAAGYPYRKITSAYDCPPSFSRTLANFAIGLEQFAPEDVKQKYLAPLAVRLDNTADRDEIEGARSRFIAIETFRRIVSVFCFDELKDVGLARRIRNSTGIDEVATQCLEMSGVSAVCRAEPSLSLARFREQGSNSSPCRMGALTPSTVIMRFWPFRYL